MPALAPAGVVFVLLAVTWRAWRPDPSPDREPAGHGGAGEPRGGPLLGALAFAAAHCVAHALLKAGPPAAPWADRVLAAEAWLYWIVLAGGAVLTVEATRRPGSLAVLCTRLPLVAATILLVLGAKLRNAWEGVEAGLWIAGLSLLMLAAWGAASRAGRRPGPGLPALLAVAASGLAVAIGLSGSAFLAQLAGATAAGFGAAWVLALRARRLSLAGGALSTAFVALYGIGLCAVFYGGLPGPIAAVFAAVPFALGAAELTALGERKTARLCVRYGLTLALVALGTGLAVRAYEPDPYGY